MFKFNLRMYWAYYGAEILCLAYTMMVVAQFIWGMYMLYNPSTLTVLAIYGFAGVRVYKLLLNVVVPYANRIKILGKLLA